MKKNGWKFLIGLLVVGGVFVALWQFGLFESFSEGQGFTAFTEDGKYDYTGKNVEATLNAYNIYTAAAINPKVYLYEEKPDNWGNGRVDVEDGYISSYQLASGTYVIAEEPGTYYARAVLNGYYDEFFEIVIPASGEVTLNDFNQADGNIEKIKMYDIETLSVSDVDLGITENASSDTTFIKYMNAVVDDDEAFKLDEVKFQEDATYSFATDTDGDGVYDEGVNKIKVVIDGQTFVPFDVASSIDEFSGDNEAVLNYDHLYEQNEAVNIKFEVTADATYSTTGDADEKLGDGEDILDSVILVDAAGNTATFDVSG